MMRFAGFWVRFLAWVLDGLIIGIPFLVLGYVFSILSGLSSIYSLIQLLSVVLVVYMEGMYGGTPGKLILGLRIEDDHGKYIGIAGALLRYVGKILSTLILGIGYLMIVWDPKKQGLHDKIAGSYVIHRS